MENNSVDFLKKTIGYDNFNNIPTLNNELFNRNPNCNSYKMFINYFYRWYSR